MTRLAAGSSVERCLHRAAGDPVGIVDRRVAVFAEGGDGDAGSGKINATPLICMIMMKIHDMMGMVRAWCIHRVGQIDAGPGRAAQTKMRGSNR